MRTLIFTLFFFPLLGEEEVVLKRADAHLVIGDVVSAYKEVKEGLALHPDSQKIKEKAIEVYAKAGKEKEMIALWKGLEDFEKHFIIEQMAWGVIQKGFKGSSPITRSIALIAAKMSESARGVQILERGLEDPNGSVRALAAQLSSDMRDLRLQRKVVALLQKERSWNAKLAAIMAVGGMQCKEAMPTLRKIIESPQTTAEEKALAVRSMASIMEDPIYEDIALLAKSHREGLRLLACEIVAVFQRKDAIPLIADLLDDHSSFVRKAALQVLGIVHAPEMVQRILPKLEDPDDEVAIIAAWAALVHGREEGEAYLSFWIGHSKQENRTLAIACLAAGGNRSYPLIEEVFQGTNDPFVKLNAAKALLGMRREVEAATEVLYQALATSKERWMGWQGGIFRAITPSQVRHIAEVPQYPEVVNQLTRLETLQILAVMRHPKAGEVMKGFLSERTFGIPSVVIALLLTEGEEESLDLIRPLLSDPDPNVKAQASLMLAIWGREEEVIQQLEEVYKTGDRQMRERVLEGMGAIGASTSLPFLVGRLGEPQQHLRMIAACAVIQCLNH